MSLAAEQTATVGLSLVGLVRNDSSRVEAACEQHDDERVGVGVHGIYTQEPHQERLLHLLSVVDRQLVDRVRGGSRKHNPVDTFGNRQARPWRSLGDKDHLATEEEPLVDLEEACLCFEAFPFVAVQLGPVSKERK